MKRKERLIAISLIAFILTEIIIISNVGAHQIKNQHSEGHITVDLNGKGNYKSIQEAVNNAEPGSTIFINNGEYKEIIKINKQITLIGENKDLTIISPISEKNKYAIYIGYPGVVIKDLSIKNNAPGLYTSAIKISSKRTEIINCNIYETAVGLAIWSSENYISNCKFWACKDEGIVLLGSSYSICNENIIENSIFYNNCDGIELQYSSNNQIKNCHFYDNSHSGIDGICSHNDNNLISNCEIYNNEVHGIYLHSSSNNKIISCKVYDNDNANIRIRGKSENNKIINESLSIILINNFRERINRLLINRPNPVFERIISIIDLYYSF